MPSLEGYVPVMDFTKGAYQHLKTDFYGRTGWLRTSLYILS